MLSINGFSNLVPYLGIWGTTVLATIFFMILIRIGFAFVLKLFRFNIDYKAPVQKKSPSYTASQIVKDVPSVK